MGKLYSSSYTVRENDNGRRIDRVVRKMFPSLSLAAVYKMIRKGYIKVSGKKISAGAHAKTGDQIVVMTRSEIEARKDAAFPDPELARRAIRLITVYEDDGLLALNKPYGMLVHGDDSLDNLVRAYLLDSIPESLSFVPGPVHRLDRNTTGLVLFAKSLVTAQFLSVALHDPHCFKYYIGVFSGIIHAENTWEDNLTRDHARKKTVRSGTEEGRKARTRLIPISSAENTTLAVCIISTGRTHQIRAQGAFHGHPLWGDVKYGGMPRQKGYILHAAGMRIPADPRIARRSLFAGLTDSTYSYLDKRFVNKAMMETYNLIRRLSSGETR